MDELDQSLIQLLRHNARRSISDLAMELGVARATVRARLERLEKRGMILGYSVILPHAGGPKTVRGIMMIEVERHNADRVVNSLSGFVQVSAIHTTNGRFDLIAELTTRDLTEFDDILRRIRLISGILASETHLLLATRRSHMADCLA